MPDAHIQIWSTSVYCVLSTHVINCKQKATVRNLVSVSLLNWAIRPCINCAIGWHSDSLSHSSCLSQTRFLVGQHYADTWPEITQLWACSSVHWTWIIHLLGKMYRNNKKSHMRNRAKHWRWHGDILTL